MINLKNIDALWNTILIFSLKSVDGKSIALSVQHDETIEIGESPYKLPQFIDVDLDQFDVPEIGVSENSSIFDEVVTTDTSIQTDQFEEYENTEIANSSDIIVTKKIFAIENGPKIEDRHRNTQLKDGGYSSQRNTDINKTKKKQREDVEDINDNIKEFFRDEIENTDNKVLRDFDKIKQNHSIWHALGELLVGNYWEKLDNNNSNLVLASNIKDTATYPSSTVEIQNSNRIESDIIRKIGMHVKKNNIVVRHKNNAIDKSKHQRFKKFNNIILGLSNLGHQRISQDQTDKNAMLSEKDYQLNEKNINVDDNEEDISKILNNMAKMAQNGHARYPADLNLDAIDKKIKHDKQHRFVRVKRQSGWDVDRMADKSWKKSWTRAPSKEDLKKKYYKKVLIIKEKDIKEARDKKFKQVVIYIGSTIGVLLLFLIFVYFVIRYPDYFVCGCCISRCIIAVCCPTLGRFLESPEKFIQERVNEYTPGFIVHEDGRVEYYPPSEDEIAALQNLMETIADSM